MTPQRLSGEDRVRLSETKPDRIRLLDLCDEIHKHLNSLKVVEAFLTDVLEEWDFEKDRYFGRWSADYLDAAVGTLITFIDDMERILEKR